jgi:DNA (cytosine-5)-methyltransferase 1
MNVLSLFSGIGGLELGLERAGMTVVGQVEINPFCRSVLKQHWPQVPKHDDVRTAVPWWQSESRPPVDVVAGGFPCQPFSNASHGFQKGVADERWGWPWMRDVVDAVRPRYVIVENVPALLRKVDAFSEILVDLSEHRFDVEWDVVSACSMGATHSRPRLFLLAHTDSDGEPMRPIDGEVARLSTLSRHIPQTLPGDLGMDDGLPHRMDRLAALGNAVVPQVAEYIGRMILEDVS